MVDCRACKKRFRADQLDDAGLPGARRQARSTTSPSPQLQPDARARASAPPRTPPPLRLSAPGDLPADLQRLQARPRGGARRRSRSASPRSARRFATRSTRATSRSARASSSRPRWSSSATRASARSGSSTGAEERLRFHATSASTRSVCARGPHADDELAHYCKAAVDVEFRFPFGWQEIEGIHDRGDWDLSRHSEYSGKDLGVTDPGDQGALRPDGDRDLGRASTAPVSPCSRTPMPRRSSRAASRGPSCASTRRWRRSRPAVLPLVEEARRARTRAARGLAAQPLQRLLRRRRQHRPTLPPPGRGRDARSASPTTSIRPSRTGLRDNSRAGFSMDPGAGRDRRAGRAPIWQERRGGALA